MSSKPNSIIHKIPVVGKAIAGIKNKFFPSLKFESSNQYWVDRYKKGGNSGEGSYGHLAEFKAKVLNDLVQKYNIKSVTEFGCGDGNQLKYLNFPSYTGYDISPEIIGQCKKLYADDSSKEFFVLSDYKIQPTDLSLSLDVIFHLVEDEVFEDYMNRLFETAKNYVVIYASNFDSKEGYAAHVRHRKFTTWIEKHQPHFEFVENVPNPYSESDAGLTTTPAEFFVFKRK